MIESVLSEVYETYCACQIVVVHGFAVQERVEVAVLDKVVVTSLVIAEAALPSSATPIKFIPDALIERVLVVAAFLAVELENVVLEV